MINEGLRTENIPAPIPYSSLPTHCMGTLIGVNEIKAYTRMSNTLVRIMIFLFPLSRTIGAVKAPIIAPKLALEVISEILRRYSSSSQFYKYLYTSDTGLN